jgi:DME family drug/metabolite transporter
VLYKFKHHKGIVLILVASLLWGTTGTVASFAPDVSPLAIGAFAMGFGGFFLY